MMDDFAERSFDGGLRVEAGGEDQTVVLMARTEQHPS
jgi:hypothetical protein